MSLRGLAARLLVLAAMAAGLAGACLLSLGIGPSPAGWSDLRELVAGGGEPSVRAILLEVRLPRLLLALLVGSALSAAGVSFQAVLRNPLADPYILGVSGGAALGAVLFTAASGAGLLDHPLGRPIAAFGGSMLTLVVLFHLARVRGRTGTTALLLVGVVLNAIHSAIILFLVTAGDASRFQGVLFYLVGSVGSPSWGVLGSVGAFVLAGIGLLTLLSHRLNLLAFGEETAGHLGLDVERTVWTAVAGASMITAAAVAFTGLIGFVGLIAPHAVRTAFGPDHRLLLPASVLGGGAFLVLADTAARTVAAPVEMPVGVVTALVGGPFFLFLYLRRLRVAS